MSKAALIHNVWHIRGRLLYGYHYLGIATQPFSAEDAQIHSQIMRAKPRKRINVCLYGWNQCAQSNGCSETQQVAIHDVVLPSHSHGESVTLSYWCGGVLYAANCSCLQSESV